MVIKASAAPTEPGGRVVGMVRRQWYDIALPLIRRSLHHLPTKLPLHSVELLGIRIRHCGIAVLIWVGDL